MSAETQPDPILPNYNPSSWDVPTLSAEERAILDTEYITFPIAQNQNITFPVAPTAPTLVDGTNTTQVATTGFVQNATTAFKAASNVWSGIQTFTAGITTATISAISGTFTITGATTSTNTTFSGTTTLSNPITPGYSYPVAAGKIGQIVTGTVSSPLTIGANTPLTVATITTLPAGMWLFFGQLGRGAGSGYLTIALNQTTNSLAGAILTDTDVTAPATGPRQVFSTLILTNTDPYYLVGQSDFASGDFSSIIFTAVRVA